MRIADGAARPATCFVVRASSLGWLASRELSTTHFEGLSECLVMDLAAVAVAAVQQHVPVLHRRHRFLPASAARLRVRLFKP